jgi:uncharacterized membrane protein YdbT with pleckstrin-like domain
MVNVIHPTPVVKVAKALLLAILLTLVLYALVGYGGDFFLDALAVIWGLAILACLSAFVSVTFTTLEIGDDDLVFKRGVLAVKTVLVPYDKVTNTRYTQSLVDRLFGVGRLDVETAGQLAFMMPAVRYDDVKGIMQNVSGSGANK